MLIQFLNAPEFTIGEDGTVRRFARWLLAAEADDGDFAVAAMLWAGQVHDNWRVPNSDGDGYTADATIRIAEIQCKVLDSASCEICYTGVPRVGAVTRIPGAYRMERRANLEEYWFDRFAVPAAALDHFLPAAGDTLEWRGETGCCVSAAADEQPDGSYQVAVTAVGCAVRAVTPVTSESGADFASVKQASWLVAASALADFLSQNQIHGSAASWAGEHYYIFHRAAEPADGGRTKVTLQARRTELQKLEAIRHEELLSCGNAALPEKEVVWIGRWRVTPEDGALFQNQLGSDASSWAEAGFVVSKITPKRISDREYEYTLEARLPESVTASGATYWRDRDLPDREEFRVRIGEMRFTPIQCGYCWNCHGQYTRVRQWNPAQQCPLVTAQPLNPRWLHQNVRLLEVVCVTYLAGASGSNIASFGNWLSGGGRVVSATLAGVTADWLKHSIRVEDIYDSRDRRWTRVTKVYRQPPHGFSWNTGYWI